MPRIQSSDFVSKEAKRDASIEALGTLLNAFAKEMSEKALTVMNNDPDHWENTVAANEFRKRLLTAFENGDMVSVATLAMIVWNLQGTQNEQ